ncbi:FAD-dependent monooxygenase [Paraburkholderia unamae]|uniref:2-polyprenyl-6-methoxyphenol hydroxylase-like FAD-dependent oxidoreductase n=1 Tax=Paraburkholderia unamae TaxID=219649 RepID=A0ABX5KSH3_9BURK|nr:FAD-dependent monooxygenase [Paraburkholderia unamae]PVX84793.1 2-polyprenyl-6-methoxyphenol hydroxylase-like FAD-dependent oxidoreductase [Paraburkholderia unamae]RAR66096.1 2-polyprenyl-6-methoxyphenol hydroxylase-like FAD-dependent oxidoreductase [Paraburkholderia unamae]CAG9271661.1 Pyridine nucleotide-disulfide oxidoreductase [Paraburkholderia unamae]
MLDVAIIGAGIGGLTLALRLHQQGMRARVYESTSELRPLGVGIVSQPYGTREITELGLLDELNAMTVDSVESIYYNQYGQEIYGERCGTHMGYPHGQRFVHRGLLQMLLYKAVIERLGPDSVVLGARCAGFTQDESGVTVRFRANPNAAGPVPEEVRADVVIGADGIKSAVREQLYPQSSKPHYSGITLWRGVTLMKPFKSGGTILHIGAPSQGSLIVYPIVDDYEGTGLTLTNWIVEQNGRDESVEDWNQKADVAEIAHMFDECKLDFVDVGEMLRNAKEVYLFPLIDHDPLQQWSFDRVALMGDAAHAMYPRGGNGACQALVDARVIAEKLAAFADPAEALKHYEAERLPIANRIVMANRGDGPEVVRRIVEDRTGGARFDDIEKVLPFAEADAIFKEYHRLAGMKRPNEKPGEASGFRSVFFEDA